MNRLEEIKERLNEQHYYAHWVERDEAVEDMQFLLSKLEIAQNALEKISGYDSYPVGIAIQALDKLKE